jgi:hypothetical protein
MQDVKESPFTVMGRLAQNRTRIVLAIEENKRDMFITKARWEELDAKVAKLISNLQEEENRMTALARTMTNDNALLERYQSVLG